MDIWRARMTVEAHLPLAFRGSSVLLLPIRERVVDHFINDIAVFPDLVAVLHGPKQVRAFHWSHAISIEIAVDLVPLQQRAAEQTLPYSTATVGRHISLLVAGVPFRWTPRCAESFKSRD